MVDVVVLNYNDWKTTSNFVDSIKQYRNIEHIVIVDNCSLDDSFEKLKLLESDKILTIRSKQNGGYGYGNNVGIRFLKKKDNPEYILLSNPDVIVSDKTIKEMEMFLSTHSEYAIVAPFMCNKYGEKQNNSAFKLPTENQYIKSLGMFYSKYKHPLQYKDFEKSVDEFMTVGAVSGSMFMFRTDPMIKYGMFDENMFLYCEEVTLGLKMHQAQQKIGLLLQETFIHNHSISISKSYRSDVAKRRLLNKSKLYVLRNYYKSRGIKYFCAVILSKIGIAETYINNFRRGRQAE